MKPQSLGPITVENRYEVSLLIGLTAGLFHVAVDWIVNGNPMQGMVLMIPFYAINFLGLVYWAYGEFKLWWLPSMQELGASAKK